MASRKKISRWLPDLKSDDPAIRREAAKRLGQYRNQEAVRPLIQTLQDENWRVRSNVASALGKLGDKEAVEPLINALSDKTATVRRTAAYALGRLRDNEAIEALCHALGDPKMSVRENAMLALDQIGVSAVPMLCQHLDDENIRLSVNATLTLSHLYKGSGLETLDRILSDRHLTPLQRWQGLEAIRASRPSRFAFGWMRDVYRFCEEVVERDAYRSNPPLTEGAKQVMEYMSLARPAQRDFASERAMLLRAAQDDPEDDSGETLLRGSSQDDIEGEETNLSKPPLFSRVLHWFRFSFRRLR